MANTRTLRDSNLFQQPINWLNIISIGLFLAFLTLQGHLWFGNGGLIRLWIMQKELHEKNESIKQLSKRNIFVQNELNSLQRNLESIEERARYDLNMIKPNEVFYQFVAKE